MKDNIFWMRKIPSGIDLCLLFAVVLSGCLLFPEPQQEVIGWVRDGDHLTPIAEALITLRSTYLQISTNQEGILNLLIPMDESEIEITA